MNSLNTRSHCTAITRKKPSVPMRHLAKIGVLDKGRKLDYGCGKGFDAEYFEMEKYDPHFSPIKPEGLFDVITCNYVFNVIHENKIPELLIKIKELLSSKGKAYITVRRDIKKEGYTKKGTYQRNVILDLPILKETSTYCTYIFSKEE